MSQIEQKIGFDKVRAMLSAKCSTKYAIGRVEEEQISCNAGEITMRLLLTDEMRLISMFEDTFPTNGYTDAKEFLLPLQGDSTYIDLPSLVLLRTTLETLRQVTAFFRDSKDGLYPTLKAMAAPIYIYPEIGRRINLIIDRFGEVRDNASEELSQIRASLHSKEKAISKSITSILKRAQADGFIDEDVTVTMRDGKALIPVPAAAKKRIAGIVYDESATGKTSFVEPLEVVELNNQVRQLQFEEQREILRILIEFTDFLRPYLDELLEGAKFLGEIDFIRAKALVAMDMVAGMPIISQTGELSLRKARHPLLERTLKREGKEIVPLTISLTRDKHILLISGPNAGGKSVCLKTVGLLQYMFQWGMLVPTSEISEFTIFDKIYVDIGDNQSIENDLSTYSSHLLSLKNIITQADNRTLVLIDEFGSGTEPVAGGAIAEAALERMDQNGVYAVINTHYTNLKLYASNSHGVINGAMMFDVAAMAPLFKLEQGLPGNSFAFELARKIGLPEDIIKVAEEKAGNDFVDMERQLRKIARNRRALDEKLNRVRTADKTLEGLTERYEKELNEVKRLKKSIIDDAKSQAAEIISGANREIERTIKEIKEAQAEKERTKIVRRELQNYVESSVAAQSDENDRKIDRKMEQILARKERERKRKEERAAKGTTTTTANVAAKPIKEEPLKVGDKVRVKESDLIGEVTQILGKNISIAIGAITSKMSLNKVERISNQEFKESSRKASTFAQSRSNIYSNADITDRKLNFSPSIDIRGERLNDAIDIVMHFMDDALMVGIGQVKILHGKGNGVLREEIRKYIRTLPGIKSIRDEAIEQGGAGITVIDFE